ncbi:MAG: ribokinase [Bacillota bacterium]|nr:ribokinase [Bacillota bacterium]
MNKICVLGSLNMDVVLKVDSMPVVGQTIIGNSLSTIPGGKGANQAVAARRAGAEVYMIGKVGTDEYGERLLEKLCKENINIQHVHKDSSLPTGTAIITVDGQGGNFIIVISGTNMAFTLSELTVAEEVITKCEVLLCQFETKMDITLDAFKMAKRNGVITLLNPAPARTVTEELLRYTDIIIPNETEALELTGVRVEDLETAGQAAKHFFDAGVKYVIITLGEKGAVLAGRNHMERIPAYQVKAVDTTAAGDSFIGAFASKLRGPELDYNDLKEAVIFGNKAAALAVQREGAQPSIPSLKEITEAYR